MSMSTITGYHNEYIGFNVEKEGTTYYLFVIYPETGRKKRIAKLNSPDDADLFILALTSIVYTSHNQIIKEVRLDKD